MINDALPKGEVFAVILAGGTGSRFWPLSRELNPKQLLSIFGEDSLIVQSITRVLPFISTHPGAIRVVTNERLLDTLREHLREQDGAWRDQLVFSCEPVARNTAPAIALAAAEVVAQDAEGILLVLPSDHVLTADAEWRAVMQRAIALATAEYLVTIGLQPTRAETGYGYIVGAQPIPGFPAGAQAPRQVRRFIEKPPRVLAEQLLTQDGVYWNAGIFCFRAARLLEEMRLAGRADIVAACEWLVAQPKSQWTSEAALHCFTELPSISIDHAVMEHSSRLAVVPARLEWDDVGSLLSLERLQPPDAHDNILIGRSVDRDSQGLTVYSTHRLIATIGLTDCLVVDTNDATLICPKERCQDIRWLTEMLKSSAASELIEPCRSYRPWGTWSTLVRQQGCEVRILDVLPGRQSHVHEHHQRVEMLIVLRGTLALEIASSEQMLTAQQTMTIPPHTPHRFRNDGDEVAQALEINLGAMLSETDVIRVADVVAE